MYLRIVRYSRLYNHVIFPLTLKQRFTHKSNFSFPCSSPSLLKKWVLFPFKQQGVQLFLFSTSCFLAQVPLPPGILYDFSSRVHLCHKILCLHRCTTGLQDLSGTCGTFMYEQHMCACMHGKAPCMCRCANPKHLAETSYISGHVQDN